MPHRLLILMFSALLTGTVTSAQKGAPFEVSYGFSLGANHSLLSAHVTGALPEGEQLRTLNNPGIDMGIFAQLDLGESIRIRPGVAVAFLNHELMYAYADGSSRSFELPNAYLEVPLHFQFAHRSITQNIAVIFGIRYSRMLEPDLNPELGLQDRFTSFEIGLGKDFDLGSFSASPEFTYNFGTQNLYRFSTTPELEGNLEQLFLDRVAFRLVFYGNP